MSDLPDVYDKLPICRYLRDQIVMHVTHHGCNPGEIRLTTSQRLDMQLELKEAGLRFNDFFVGDPTGCTFLGDPTGCTFLGVTIKDLEYDVITVPHDLVAP